MAGPVRAPQPRMAHALVGAGAAARQLRRLLRRAAGFGSASRPIVARRASRFQQWQVVQKTRELEELDAQILTSDLPIDAYLDRGFQNWLTRREP